MTTRRLGQLRYQIPILFTGGSAYESAVRNIGTPTMWIRASEASGSTLADSSGNSYNLSIAGVPTFNQPGLGSNTGPSIESDGATVNFSRASGGELIRKNSLSMCLAQFGSAGEANIGAIEFFNTGVNNSGLKFSSNSLNMRYIHETGVGGTGVFNAITTTTLAINTTYWLFWGMSDTDNKPHIYYATIGGTVTEATYSLQQTASGTDTAYTALGIFSNNGTTQSCDGLLDEYVHWNNVDIEAAATQTAIQALVDVVGAP